MILWQAVRGFTITLFVSLAIGHGLASEQRREFSQGGLSFSYPPDWVLSDKSTPQAQHLTLTRPKTSLMIMLVAYRDAIASRDQLLAATGEITEPYIRSIAEKFGDPQHPGKRDSSCVKIGGVSVAGVQVRGAINNQAATAEIYAFPRGRRFINLIYIRTNAEEQEGVAAWNTIRDTLKVETIATTAGLGNDDLELLGGNAYGGGILNGKALSLPRPEYPSFARAAGAAGPVVVQITVDEKGQVVAVHPVSGHRLLYGAAEDAARRAKFSPTTLCGQPVKVIGTIVFNFVPNQRFTK